MTAIPGCIPAFLHQLLPPFTFFFFFSFQNFPIYSSKTLFGCEKSLLLAFPPPTEDQSLVQAFLVPRRAGSGLISCLPSLVFSTFLSLFCSTSPALIHHSLIHPKAQEVLLNSSQIYFFFPFFQNESIYWGRHKCAFYI